jgi:hypothetical protein
VNRRRLAAIAVPSIERRTGSDRRRADRRESAAGHLRNALQILVQLSGQLDTRPEQELVGSTMRRIWLALSQIENPKDMRP